MAEYYIAPKTSFDATADAIREKIGSQATIEWTQDGFADAIEEIGGDNREDLTVPKDVDFIDFDGRLVYSYTTQEFLALTELPPNPSYPGLTAQGWNWTLADAKEFVQEYGAQVIGQNYITDDGKTRLYITLPNNTFQAFEDSTYAYNFTLFVYKCGATNVFTIDWGDGNTQQVSSNNTGNLQNTTHKYSVPGDYVISIEVATGTSIRLGYQGSNHSVFSSDIKFGNCCTKVEIGSGVVGFCRNAFCNCYNMRSISIPVTCTDHDTGSDVGWFCGPSLLQGVVIPKNTPGINANVIGSGSNSHIKYFSVPRTMTGFRWNSTHPKQLRKIILPNYTTNTTLDLYMYDVQSLTHCIIPGTYTNITTDRVRSSLIRKLTIPATVTSIAATAFTYNNFCEEVHLLPSSPPTLSNVSAFRDIGSKITGGCVFYVPYSADHSILEAYQTATNWSTYASQMQEEPQT